MNIVSLLPSTTEIIFDLGLEDQLRGVTIECNWPAKARAGREIVVDTFTKPGMTPGEIDAIVKERMAAGLDLYNLDDDALARCAPDLILSQDLCRVCAVASGDVDAAMARLRCDATLLQIDPQNLLEVIESINTIAQAAGVSDRGLALTQALHERLLAVSENVKGKTRPAVFVLEWIDPPFGAGHWVPDIVNAAGVHADQIARSIGVGTEFACLPFKGVYRVSRRLISSPKTLIYPVPHSINPFLGVHITLTLDGDIKIGPTAMPLFGREQYSATNHVEFREIKDSLKSMLSLVKGKEYDLKEILLLFQILFLKQSNLKIHLYHNCHISLDCLLLIMLSSYQYD